MLNQIVVGKRKSCIVLPLAVIVAIVCFGAGPAKAQGKPYAALERKLVADGFPRRVVSDALRYASPPMLGLVCATMRTGGGRPDYSHFLALSEIAAVHRFIYEHRNCFREEKAEFGVEPEIIAALMLVETHFGAYTGKTPTLAVFSTFAIMDQKANRDRVWSSISPQDRANWGRRAFDQKLLDRASWAYRELCALFKLQKMGAMRIAGLKGSVMGAIGWPQFLPTSLVKYGVDGNGDGRINLNNAEDAIFSTGNYLRAYGWCEAGTRSQKEAVIFNYNHSTPYVQTVLGIAQRAGLR
ncbi:MAG: lytic murein transglycosylase [Syntrophobacteraceae bacterium]|nr:lytic murein transglycosylase [Syntrophobacteraceae bacterium]